MTAIFDDMRATVLSVSANAAHDVYTLSLSFPSSDGERVALYRVGGEEYCAAGAPSERDVLEGEELYLIIRAEEEKRAYARALRILASGDNSARALQRKLCERGFDARAARTAAERLVREGYLREEEMLLRQFAIFAKRLWGEGKYMPVLLSKGFSRELIERVRERASDEGVYDAECVREELLSRFAPKGYAEERALLYKYGFR